MPGKYWGKQKQWSREEVATRERLYGLMLEHGHALKQTTLADLMHMTYREVERYLCWMAGRKEVKRISGGGWIATARELATRDPSPFPRPWWPTPNVGLWGDASS